MNESIELKRLNVEGIHPELFQRFKLTVLGEGKTIKQVILDFIRDYAGGDDLVKGIEGRADNPGSAGNSNPGDFFEKVVEKIGEKIEEILDLKLIGLNQAENPGVDKNSNPGVDKGLDKENEIYQTKPDHESPVKPAVKPAEKSAVVEEVITAENGVVVIGKKVEKRKRSQPFFPHEF